MVKGRIDIKTELQTHYVLFSAEGAGEGIILNKLFDAGMLIVPSDRVVKDRMTFKPFTRLRKANQIADQFLNESYPVGSESRLLIARLIDSSTPAFPLPKQYRDTAIVRSFITSPEIEMLVIYKESALDAWKRKSRQNRQLKPSDFCKQYLKISDLKSQQFLEEYWSDEVELVSCIQQYAQHHTRKSPDTFFLVDLLA